MKSGDATYNHIESMARRLGVEDPRAFAGSIMDKARKKMPEAGDAMESSPEKAPVGDSVSIGANIADHLNNNPVLEKLNALIASALVVSGAGTVIAGIKNRDRDQVLRGSKQTMWGVYHGLNAIDTVFNTAMSVTPGLRAIGGFINVDLGVTQLYKDYKKNGKLDHEKTLFHSAAVAWGLRHMAKGLEGLAGSRWVAKMVEKGSPAFKAVASKAPLLGIAGATLGLTGGVLDAALGVRGIVKGVKEGDSEKKKIGMLDVTAGLAMGVSCLLTGVPGIGAAVVGSGAMAYRFWRTDREAVGEVWNSIKAGASRVGQSIKKGVGKIIGRTPSMPAPEGKPPGG